MSPELVRPGLKVWVHSHHRMPECGTIVNYLKSYGPYSWITVAINGHHSDYEIGRVTVYGNKNDLAYYYHNGQRLLYKNQAAYLM